MIKYATPIPCICLSEIDANLYINFEFCEGKKSKPFVQQIDLQSQALYVDKKISRKVYLF